MSMEHGADRIWQELSDHGIPCRMWERMERHTTFAIGGAARYFVLPQSEEQLKIALSLAQQQELPACILGRGSNVLFGDEPYDGMVIGTAGLRELSAEVMDDASGEYRLYAQCGVSLRELALLAHQLALPGIEFLHGIPGSVGGALRMNAGAFGGEIGAWVYDVRCYHVPSGEVVSFLAEECAFGYRHSILSEQPQLVCLGASFTLRRDMSCTEEQSRQQIAARMDDYKHRRRQTQPLEFPSAGSVFKRPEGHFAGKLIEDCALKGRSVGGAQVSEKHAGFIINQGHAQAADVRTLIAQVQAEVLARFGVRLEEELVFLGAHRASEN